MSEYIYNDKKAEYVIKFIEDNCVHVEGQWAGKPFLLFDWQKDIIKELFGTVENKTGLRRFREFYCEIGRKNGKSTLAAAIALYMLVADGEYGAQVVSVASIREQARIVFSMASKMVRMSPTLSSILDVQKNVIYYPQTQSTYKVIAAEAGAAHGMNLHAVIYDELHMINDGEMYAVLKSSMGARRQPLVMSFTTAGTDRNTFCHQMHEYAEGVTKGMRNDPRFLSRIYTIDEGDDWKDSKNWYKACPSLGKTVPLSYLEYEYNRTKELPSYEVTFKTLYLCVWTNVSSVWIKDDDWMACSDPSISIEDFEGEECVIGCDLSATDDLTSVVFLFKREGLTHIFPYFFLPDENIVAMGRVNKADYISWVEHNYLNLTQGPRVDYAQVADFIVEMGRKYKIKTCALDYNFNGGGMTNLLSAENVHVTRVQTNIKTISEPSKAFEILIATKKLRHNNNPCMRWNINNVVIYRDCNGNIRPDKLKGRRKIDGAMAAITGLYMADLLSEQTNQSSSVTSDDISA